MLYGLTLGLVLAFFACCACGQPSAPSLASPVPGLKEGDAAPVFNLDLLDGGVADLCALTKQRRVVVLDFWATWCGPCRAGLPVIDALREKYPADKVQFYAVNLREESAVVHAFVKKTSMKMPVALDRDGAVAAAYGVSGIPRTIVIGGDGTIQNLEASTNGEPSLRSNIDDLLAGKPLVGQPPRPVASIDGLPDGRRLQWLWTTRCEAAGVVWDGSRSELAGMGNSTVHLSREGVLTANAPMRCMGTLQWAANLTGDAAAEVVTSSPWAQDVQAWDASGKLLWTYSRKDGVDDVGVGDIDGDGLDEVVVSYNAAGVRCLSSDGKLRWQSKFVAWSAIPTKDDNKSVIAAAGIADAAILDAGGGIIRRFHIPLNGRFVRSAGTGSKAALIFAGGKSNDRGEAVVCSDLTGRVVWNLELPSKSISIIGLSASTSAPFAAVELGKGGVLVAVDTNSGAFIATCVGWHSSFFTTADGRTAIAVRDSRGITAYAIKPE